MKRTYVILFLILVTFSVQAKNNLTDVAVKDTNKVIALNRNAFDSRFSNPKETIKDAVKAMELAIKLDYKRGIAESYRVKGVGENYLNLPDSALNSFSEANNIFEKLGDEEGMAAVYNNIGNLYQMVDYEKALENFRSSLTLAQKHHNTKLIASVYLNMGNIYNRKNSYNLALSSYNKSYELFKQFTDEKSLANQVLCLANLGVLYYNLRNFAQAKEYLMKAHDGAKERDMNASVATINLTLTDLFVAEGNFKEAEKYLEEGKTYSNLLNNEKDIYDYKHTAYEMERKRKNYEKALNYLINIYMEDSTSFRNNVSTKLDFVLKEQKRIVQKTIDEKNEEFSKVIFWSVAVIAVLLMVVIVMLIGSVKRKATTNLQLQELNGEISRQKDNLDRINHHLEEIIDERTKDLQVKNRKLSDYSSYLSHQIRGPIATLKGLMNLEKEGLVGQLECIRMMDKCVSEIDEKIIEMSDMLHDRPN